MKKLLSIAMVCFLFLSCMMITPVSANLSGVVDIQGNYLLKSDGTVWSFGQNRYGSCGRGFFSDEYLDLGQVINLTNITQLSVGGVPTVLKSDGTVWTWGRSYFQQVGGSMNMHATPIQVQNLPTITFIDAGPMTTLAVSEDGEVYQWGYDHTGNHQQDVHLVDIPEEVVKVSNFTFGHAALTVSGKVYIWGTFAETTMVFDTPTLVTLGASKIVDINQNYATDTRGFIYRIYGSTGNIFATQATSVAGINTYVNSYAVLYPTWGMIDYVNGTSSTEIYYETYGIIDPVRVECFGGVLVIFTSSGEIYIIGTYDYSQINAGNITYSSTPVLVY